MDINTHCTYQAEFMYTVYNLAINCFDIKYIMLVDSFQ